MKTLEQFYEEIQNNEELKQEFTSSFKEGVLDDFLKDHDCDATAEDVMNFMNSLKDGAVSDNDLDNVAGGGFTAPSWEASCNRFTWGCR